MREQGALQRTNVQDTLEKKYFQARHENIDTLVEHQLILQEFKTFNVPESIVESEVDREIEAEIKSRFGDRITLINTLHEEGLTMEKHRRQIRDHMIISWLTQKNVQSELLISPHKVLISSPSSRFSTATSPAAVGLRSIVSLSPTSRSARS